MTLFLIIPLACGGLLAQYAARFGMMYAIGGFVVGSVLGDLALKGIVYLTDRRRPK